MAKTNNKLVKVISVAVVVCLMTTGWLVFFRSDNNADLETVSPQTTTDQTENSNGSTSTTPSTDPVTDPTGPEQPPVAVEPPVVAGDYIDYDQTTFQNQSQNNRWLYFHADWCPICNQLEKDIKANLSQIPDNTIIFKVDYDKYQDLKKRYLITQQTTIVAVDNQGQAVETYSAYNQPTLAAIVEHLTD